MAPFTEREQTDAVEKVHSALDKVTLGNHHGAVVGIGGTARTGTKVKVIRALLAARGEGGILFDVGCGFGHMMLAASTTGFDGACGCDFPDNKLQRQIIDSAKAKLGIDPDTICEWIGTNVMDLVMPERLRRRITAVYSFWNGFGPAPQHRTLELCRDTLIDVRSVAVYLDKEWRTPLTGMAADQFTFSLQLLNPRIQSKSNRVFFQPVLAVLNKGAAASSPNWILYATIQHFSVGNGEKHTAWVFHRQARAD